MKDISDALYNIRKIDELGDRDTVIHRIDSSIKIIVTLIYIIRALLMKNFSLLNMIAALSYPMAVFMLGKVNPKDILRKTIFVLPVVIAITIANLLIDFSYNEICYCLLLMFKCVFALIGSLLLIVTTGMNNFSAGLRKLKVPDVIVTELLLLYRYIVLMMEELLSIKSSYRLRSGKNKNIEIKHWGMIMGHMMLKSIDRSENVYGAMKLRGFSGQYYCSENRKINYKDIGYLIFWSGVFILL